MGSRDAEVTVGINWYLKGNRRFMFNWVHAVPAIPGAGPSALSRLNFGIEPL